MNGMRHLVVKDLLNLRSFADSARMTAIARAGKARPCSNRAGIGIREGSHINWCAGVIKSDEMHWQAVVTNRKLAHRLNQLISNGCLFMSPVEFFMIYVRVCKLLFLKAD